MGNEEAVDVDIYKINRIIRKYSLIASASGFIPMPIVDLAALSAVQLRMIHEIGREYGFTFSEHAGKSLGISALNSLAAPSMAAVGASALKIIPGVGNLLGKYAFHGYAAASTYAMGKIFNNHFASGGNLLTFDVEKVKDSFKELVNQYEGKGAPAKKAPAKG